MGKDACYAATGRLKEVRDEVDEDLYILLSTRSYTAFENIIHTNAESVFGV